MMIHVFITDAAVQSIVQNCPSIDTLSLKKWSGITDLSMTYLTHLSCLRSIDLLGCREVSSAGVQELLRTNRKIETLILPYKANLSFTPVIPAYMNDALLRCIGVNCPNLIKLQIRVGPRLDLSVVSDAGFEAMIKGLPALESFALSEYDKSNTILPLLGTYCPRLRHVHIDKVKCNDDDVVSMCQGCPLLESLHLSDVETLTDVSVHAIASSINLLSRLRLSYNVVITDDSLCALFTSCIRLTTVELSNLPKITNKAIATLLSCCPELRDLSLDSCPLLTDHCLLSIPMHCPLIERLRLSYIA